MKWSDVKEDFPKDKKVMVVFLEPFFGYLSSEITMACFNNEDDHDEDCVGWYDYYTNNKLLVTHWAEIPKTPVNPPAELDQEQFTKEYYDKHGTVIKRG